MDSRHNEAQMLILVHYLDSLPTESPGAGLLVVGHVRLGTNDNNLGLIRVKL